MSIVSTGLSHDGRTTHFQIRYDTALPRPAVGPGTARGL